jgi:hypothetical protein
VNATFRLIVAPKSDPVNVHEFALLAPERSAITHSDRINNH